MIENVFIPLRIVKRGSYRGRILSTTYSSEERGRDEVLISGLLKSYLWEKIIYKQFGGDMEMFCLKKRSHHGKRGCMVSIPLTHL